MTTTKTSLADFLAALGLRTTAAQLDDLIARATKHRWSVPQLLEHVAQTEQDDRARRGLERRLTRSRLHSATMHSISTWAPRGSEATPTAARAG